MSVTYLCIVSRIDSIWRKSWCTWSMYNPPPFNAASSESSYLRISRSILRRRYTVPRLPLISTHQCSSAKRVCKVQAMDTQLANANLGEDMTYIFRFSSICTNFRVQPSPNPYNPRNSSSSSVPRLTWSLRLIPGFMAIPDDKHVHDD